MLLGRKHLKGVVVALLFFTAAARAENWPAHGFFQTQEGDEEEGGRYCQVSAKAIVGNTPFTFYFRAQDDGKALIAFFGNGESIRMTPTMKVRVGIDGKEVLHYAPMAWPSEGGPKMMAVTIVEAGEANAMIERLRRASAGARSLQVETQPYAQIIPAEGMHAAMQDFVACRNANR